MIINNTKIKKEPVPPLVKVCEIARLLSISRVTVHHLIDSGDLAAYEIRPTRKKRERFHRRVTLESLLVFYEKRFGHPLPQALANPFKP